METTLNIICGVLVIMTWMLWSIQSELYKRNLWLKQAIEVKEAGDKLSQLRDKINDDQTNGKPD